MLCDVSPRQVAATLLVNFFCHRQKWKGISMLKHAKSIAPFALAFIIFRSITPMDGVLESTAQKVHVPSALGTLPSGINQYLLNLPRVAHIEELDKAARILKFVKLFSIGQCYGPWRRDPLFQDKEPYCRK